MLRFALALTGRRRLIALATVAVAGLTAPAAAPGATSRSDAAPALRLHAIFSGGRASRFHAGEVLQVGVRHAGARRLAQVCWSPAPIARPACSRSGTGAPAKAGTSTVTATLDDGTKLTRSFRVLPAASKVGGPVAVPATIRCHDVTLFGNYDHRLHRSRDPVATIRRGARIALYNRIARNVIFMWIYATNQGGFGSERCAQPVTA